VPACVCCLREPRYISFHTIHSSSTCRCHTLPLNFYLPATCHAFDAPPVVAPAAVSQPFFRAMVAYRRLARTNTAPAAGAVRYRLLPQPHRRCAKRVLPTITLPAFFRTHTHTATTTRTALPAFTHRILTALPPPLPAHYLLDAPPCQRHHTWLPGTRKTWFPTSILILNTPLYYLCLSCLMGTFGGGIQRRGRVPPPTPHPLLHTHHTGGGGRRGEGYTPTFERINTGRGEH